MERRSRGDIDGGPAWEEAEVLAEEVLGLRLSHRSQEGGSAPGHMSRMGTTIDGYLVRGPRENRSLAGMGHTSDHRIGRRWLTFDTDGTKPCDPARRDQSTTATRKDLACSFPAKLSRMVQSFTTLRRGSQGSQG